ncbi:MAG: hypothetical protein KBB94_06135 [Legionellaceae bacterium]|nr:hypothetical protein [Legionellaceae bacterium]MBP9775911.1 hypothetical protein [Legionellaceae bacterium]
MEKQTNRTLAYLLAEPIQDNHELEAISGGHTTLSAQRTARVTGDSSQGPEITLDFSVDT